MTDYKVTIAVFRIFNNKANALSAQEALEDKVPDEWHIETSKVERV